MHRQLAEVHMYQPQPSYHDYSPPIVPISGYEMYAPQSSTTTPIPTYTHSNGIHLISTGNTPPPNAYVAPPPHHPLTGAAPINYPPPQSSLGGAAAANVNNGHNGYAIAQTGAVPSSSGGYPEAILSHHAHQVNEEDFTSAILNAYEQNFEKIFERNEETTPAMFINQVIPLFEGGDCYEVKGLCAKM